MSGKQRLICSKMNRSLGSRSETTNRGINYVDEIHNALVNCTVNAYFFSLFLFLYNLIIHSRNLRLILMPPPRQKLISHRS